MLVDVKFSPMDPVLAMVTGFIAGDKHRKHISKGLYEIGHFNFAHEMGLRDYEREYIDIGDIGGYGVCDSPEQFTKRLGEALDKDPRQLVVSLTHVPKVPGEEGGWRWHKWGEYIGEGKPTTEYLADESEFKDGVWVYHIFDVTDLPLVV